jgi:hypothetical protein
MPGQNVCLTGDALAVLDAWWTAVNDSKDSAARVLDIVKQLLMVLAVTNLPVDHKAIGAVTVGRDVVEAATRFGDYLMAVRDIIDPNDSWSAVQALENDIIEWFKKHASKTKPVSMNDCRRGVHPHRKPGGLGAFNIAWKNAVNAEVVKYRGKGQRSALYSL